MLDEEQIRGCRDAQELTILQALAVLEQLGREACFIASGVAVGRGRPEDGQARPAQPATQFLCNPLPESHLWVQSLGPDPA